MLVKDVKFKNNKVEIVLEDTSFFISKENYIENPVTINSFIDQDKIKCLLAQEKYMECKGHIIKLLNKKMLSEYEVWCKLKEWELEKDDALKIIDSLKRMGLINDEYFASLFVSSMLVKRKGRLEIYSCLKEKKIEDKIILKALDEIDYEEYKNNFYRVRDKYLKMYSNRSCGYKEKMVKTKLKEYGYEENLISEVCIEKNNEQEYELVKNNLLKLLRSKKMDLSNHENVNKIKIKLANKGFNYDIINSVLEEVVNDETY